MKKVKSWSLTSFFNFFFAVGVLVFFSRFHVPIPFSNVPATLLSFCFYFLLAFFPVNLLLVAFTTWFVCGLLGAPVFATACGWGIFMSPALGYVMGIFLFLATMSFLGLKFPNRGNLFQFLFLAFAGLVVLASGAIYLSFFLGCIKAFRLGFVPFVYVEAIKIAVVVLAKMFFREKL